MLVGLATAVRRCLLVRPMTCLMTGANRRNRYLPLPKKWQKLSGQLVPKLPIIVTVPYLMLRPPSRCTLRTIPRYARVFEVAWWNLLRNLRGLLTETFMS